MKLKALVLRDDPGTRYGSKVLQKIKTIETRMQLFKYSGDLLICIANSSESNLAGFAVCIVHFAKGRPMQKKDERKACIESIPGRYAYDLTNFRGFEKHFKFAPCKIFGSFQTMFDVELPKGTKLIPY